MKSILILLSCLPLLAGEFEINLLIDGKPAQQYAKGGAIYVEGTPGSVFSLELKNNTGNRALFVPVVDGLSALDGKAPGNTPSGYVVGAYSTYRVEGWRTSLEKVRQFEFTKKGNGNTYAEKMTGSADGCGILSVKIVKEKPPIIEPALHFHIDGSQIINLNANADWPEISDVSISNTSVLVSSINTSATLDLGTKFGNESRSVVREIEFERGETCGDFTIYYASRDRLQAMGIKLLPVTVASNEFCPEPVSFK